MSAATSHLLAMLLGLLLAAALMLYLMEDRRALVPTLLLAWLAAAGVSLLIAYGFHVDAASYVLRGGAALFTLSPTAPRLFLRDPHGLPFTILLAVAVALWITSRRSNYFGHTAPLAIGVFFAFLVTTQVPTTPLVWALPFLLVFLAGVFADACATRYGRWFAALAATAAVAQAVLCLASLPALTR